MDIINSLISKITLPDQLILFATSIEKKILEVAEGGGHSSKFDDLQESQTRPLSFIEYQYQDCKT